MIVGYDRPTPHGAVAVVIVVVVIISVGMAVVIVVIIIVIVQHAVHHVVEIIVQPFTPRVAEPEFNTRPRRHLVEQLDTGEPDRLGELAAVKRGAVLAAVEAKPQEVRHFRRTTD